MSQAQGINDIQDSLVWRPLSISFLPFHVSDHSTFTNLPTWWLIIYGLVPPVDGEVFIGRICVLFIIFTALIRAIPTIQEVSK